MKYNRIINLLKEHITKIQSYGVLHLAVFGSYARGEENDKSDIDIAVVMNDDHDGVMDLVQL